MSLAEETTYQNALFDLEREFREIASRALAGAVLAHMLATNEQKVEGER